jgi:ParB-like chromosome segregation protein Spo0J
MGPGAMSKLEIRYVSPDGLRPYTGNARTHSKKQIRQIADSIERFGFANPVLVSQDGEIIAGHGRLAAAKLLSLASVPVVVLADMTEADRRAYVMADNKLAELAGWDRDILAIELQFLQDVQFDDIEVTGFSLGEIDISLTRPRKRARKSPAPKTKFLPNSPKPVFRERVISGFSEPIVCFVAMHELPPTINGCSVVKWPTWC